MNINQLSNLLILVMLAATLISCQPQKHLTYKGKYENGMFAGDPRDHPQNLGMYKKKKPKKINMLRFNFQNNR